MIRKLVGYRIKELRINNANMTQEAFAKILKCSRTYLSKIESGKQNLTLDSLDRICKLLNVSLKEFFMYMDDIHIEE